MHRLAQKNKDKVIDLLTERLQYERTAVALYDAIMPKMRSSADPEIVKMLPQMMEHREQEKEHEEWLEEQIRNLGGDTHAETEMSKLSTLESEGIGKVVLDGDPNIAHLFHALLSAELVDNAGWDLLVDLADEADDRDAKRSFKKRLHEEEDHLVFVRKALEKFMQRDVLGERVSMPTHP